MRLTRVSDHLWEQVKHSRKFFEGYVKEVDLVARQEQAKRDAEIAAKVVFTLQSKREYMKALDAHVAHAILKDSGVE